MKKALLAIGLVLALGSALAIGNLAPSVALRGGYAGVAAFGLEASWNCILYQPPVGALRPTLDLGYAGGFSGSFAMRYLTGLPGVQGLRLGGGAGVGYGGVFFGLVRGDLEYDLPVSGLPAPLFVGADAGYAFAFTGVGSPFAAVKVGLRF